MQVHGEWEDGYFYVASYYDKVMMAVTGPERPEKRGDFIVQVTAESTCQYTLYTDCSVIINIQHVWQDRVMCFYTVILLPVVYKFWCNG